MRADVDASQKHTHHMQLFCNLNLSFSRLRKTACQIDALSNHYLATKPFFFINNQYTELQCSYYISDYLINFTSSHIFVRFTTCNQPDLWWPDLHLHLHWWTCYHCHLEEKWNCDNAQCYPPAEQESSWSCCGYLPDSAHHWPISGSESNCGDIQLHSGECQRKIIKDSGCNKWELKPCNQVFNCYHLW